ncbi:hypothetical protein ACP70R_024175 [Stipagrostis hirtigluma subsp. patula]
MAGSDLPPGGSGAPPSSPAGSRKRKRGVAAADGAASATKRATRSSAQLDVDGAVRWARRAAAGALWEVRGRNRGIDDEEALAGVVLALRQELSALEPDDPDSPYAKIQKRHYRQGTRSSGRIAGNPSASYLASKRKRIGIDPVQYQASVPEWENAPSEKDKADYKTDNLTLEKMGTVIMPPSTVNQPKLRSPCKCSHPGSEACVGVHVNEASRRLKYQMGEEAFKNCGLDAMGAQVLDLWTAEDKEKLEDIEKLIPDNKHESFMKIASKQFSSKSTRDLAKYYYNVFLPRRLATLTRREAKDATEVSTDDEGNDQHDDNNEHLSEGKSRRSGSSSKSIWEVGGSNEFSGRSNFLSQTKRTYRKEILHDFDCLVNASFFCW